LLSVLVDATLAKGVAARKEDEWLVFWGQEELETDRACV
tara:strand:- start:448 stop:564 length:117 start_codon:yes stop_codon:yes gene_type:complete